MHIKEKFGQLVAQNSRSSLGNMDAALKDTNQLLTTLIEVSQISNAPLKIDQPIYEQCSDTIVGILSARRNMTRLITSMDRVKGEGNLSDTILGCPRGLNEEPTHPIMEPTAKTDSVVE